MGADYYGLNRNEGDGTEGVKRAEEERGHLRVGHGFPVSWLYLGWMRLRSFW